MHKRLLYSLGICYLILTAFGGAKNYPQDYFDLPVKRAAYLSGTFGELRANHFHSGIDIKSVDGKVGEALYAAAEGYVSRIKVQSGGYGNSLYINHPNGYTTVYAHLSAFSPEVAAYVKSKQYGKRSFTINLYPEKDKFQFAKGEEIGKLGTTGRSFGPHLHFEIRKTNGQIPINPLLCGLKVPDTEAPIFEGFRIYHLDADMNQTKVKELKAGRDIMQGDSLYIDGGQIGLGAKVFDSMEGVSNKNGVYDLNMEVDGKSVFQMKLTEFSFGETRYCNAQLDHALRLKEKSYYNRCYKLPGNRFSAYQKVLDSGLIELASGAVKDVKLTASDPLGNASSFSFTLIGSKDETSSSAQTYMKMLPFDAASAVETAIFSMQIPAGSFYRNVPLTYSTSSESSDDIYSDIVHLGPDDEAVHKKIDLALKANQALTTNEKGKYFIAQCGKDGVISNIGGKWLGSYLTASIRSMGDFCIMIDDVAPTIIPETFEYDMRSKNRITFTIKDQISSSGSLNYKSRVDGKWILFEYDAKNDLIIHRFDERIGPGEHILVLDVYDQQGNKARFERSFLR